MLPCCPFSRIETLRDETLAAPHIALSSPHYTHGGAIARTSGSLVREDRARPVARTMLLGVIVKPAARTSSGTTIEPPNASREATCAQRRLKDQNCPVF